METQLNIINLTKGNLNNSRNIHDLDILLNKIVNNLTQINNNFNKIKKELNLDNNEDVTFLKNEISKLSDKYNSLQL
jgi:hypothetical protein